MTVGLFYSCEKKEDVFSVMKYVRSDGKVIEARNIGDILAFKGVRDDSLYFYQIEGHHNHSASLRFVGKDSNQCNFDSSEIELFFIPNYNFESELKFLSGSVELVHKDAWLEGTFCGKVSRRWVYEDGTRIYTNDTLEITEGYFKVSLQNEYYQTKF